MIVRFATKCDTCGQRSEEYTAWPTCRECQNDACFDCSEPGTMEDDDGRQTVVCRQCAKIEGQGPDGPDEQADRDYEDWRES